MMTLDKNNYERFRVARIKAGLPSDLLSKQVDKMLDAALLICDAYVDGDTSLQDKDLEKAILDLIKKRMKEDRF
jgi:hypothetical protein